MRLWQLFGCQVAVLSKDTPVQSSCETVTIRPLKTHLSSRNDRCMMLQRPPSYTRCCFDYLFYVTYSIFGARTQGWYEYLIVARFYSRRQSTLRTLYRNPTRNTCRERPVVRGLHDGTYAVFFYCATPNKKKNREKKKDSLRQSPRIVSTYKAFTRLARGHYHCRHLSKNCLISVMIQTGVSFF